MVVVGEREQEAVKREGMEMELDDLLLKLGTRRLLFTQWNLYSHS